VSCGHAVVFVGPSLPGRRRWSASDIDIRPPVELGDVLRAVDESPAVIAIIDGRFDSVPAVWHKEILWALHRGIHVLGASSMGALRAAELVAFGMVGVGQIFRAYASELIEDDDEVAIIHAPAEYGYRSLSEPLVNIRVTLADALACDVVSADVADVLLRETKHQHYAERSWRGVIEAGRLAGVAESILASLTDWLANHARNAKQEDAAELLGIVRTLLDTAVPAPSRPFQPTALWEQLRAQENCLERVIDELLLRNPLDPEVRRTLAAARAGQCADVTAAVEAMPDFPELCRRAARKRTLVAELDQPALSDDAELTWLFDVHFGFWPDDMADFLRDRAWHDPGAVASVAHGERLYRLFGPNDRQFDHPRC
jgi:hypothetical protein